jgi:hypothetical protein
MQAHHHHSPPPNPGQRAPPNLNQVTHPHSTPEVPTALTRPNRTNPQEPALIPHQAFVKEELQAVLMAASPVGKHSPALLMFDRPVVQFVRTPHRQRLPVAR